jgi:hypothetical protein
VTDLVTWLRQQLDEDERTADSWHWDSCDEVIDRERSMGCDCGLPKRVLAEVAVKRAILDLHEPAVLRGGEGAKYYETRIVCRSCEPPRSLLAGEPDPWPCPTVRLLALPYALNPGYDESWRPA